MWLWLHTSLLYGRRKTVWKEQYVQIKIVTNYFRWDSRNASHLVIIPWALKKAVVNWLSQLKLRICLILLMNDSLRQVLWINWFIKRMIYSQIRVSELKLRADRPVLLISQYIKKIRHKTMTHSQTEHLYIPSRTHRVELKQIFSVLTQIYHKISEDFKMCLLHITFTVLFNKPWYLYEWQALQELSVGSI